MGKLTPAKMIDQLAKQLNEKTAEKTLYVEVRRYEPIEGKPPKITTEYYPLNEGITVTEQGNFVLTIVTDGMRVEGQV